VRVTVTQNGRFNSLISLAALRFFHSLIISTIQNLAKLPTKQNDKIEKELYDSQRISLLDIGVVNAYFLDVCAAAVLGCAMGPCRKKKRCALL
jgi:hypothetical protein